VVSLQELRSALAREVPAGRGDEDSVRRQWWAALATVQEDLLPTGSERRGVWLAAPLPALYEPDLLRRLEGWVWAPREIDDLLHPPPPLLPGAGGDPVREGPDLSSHLRRLPLREADGTDPLLVLITPRMQVALALDGPAEARRLLVRFEATVLSAALDLLDRRLQEDDPTAARRLRMALRDLGTLHNDPGLGLRFWPLLAQRLAGMAPSLTLQPLVQGSQAEPPKARAASSELALLEALTHEVRTPLATIRTLIRSLLRRDDLPTVARQRLEQIDGECSEQIDRFGLIFLAAELHRQPGSGQPLTASELARTDLSQLLTQLEDLWRRQLVRRGLSLRLAIAPDLPPVLSDPTRLETMLGGLIDRFSRGLPSGSQVRISLLPAGSRLKLRVSNEEPPGGEGTAGASPPQADSERVGPVLSWNPATGSLQLSRQATQQLFHRLGGRLTERGASTLTVFFPVADRQA
jgi:signal transduction histidine kinase